MDFLDQDQIDAREEEMKAHAVFIGKVETFKAALLKLLIGTVSQDVLSLVHVHLDNFIDDVTGEAPR